VHYTAIQYGASSLTSPPYDWAVQADHLMATDEEPYVAEELRREDAECLAVGWNRHPTSPPTRTRLDAAFEAGRPRSTAAAPPSSARRPVHLSQEPHHARAHLPADQVREIERLALQQTEVIHTHPRPQQDLDPCKAHRDAEWVGYGEAVGVRLGLCVALAVLRGSDPDVERRTLEEVWTSRADG
jgi:hypothetical protein